MPKTGEICRKPGLYAPACGCSWTGVKEGNEFPPCPGCEKDVDWELTDPAWPVA